MISKIDSKSAVVLIDFQKSILAVDAAHDKKAVVAQTAKLIEAARKAHFPIIFVTVNTGEALWTKTRKEVSGFPQIADRSPEKIAEMTTITSELPPQPTDIFIEKENWSAFPGTALDAELKKHGCTSIILTGIATSIGVEGTARDASVLGYNITFALDAMTDPSLEAHDNSIKHIFPRIGESGLVDEIIAKIPQ